jgi:uncharacterized protein (DUF4415 family)
MKRLTREQKRDIAAVAAKRDQDVDFSDIPATVDWSRAEVGKFHRPPKKSVTMRLDADILQWLKAYGKGYQTRVNLLLRHAMMSSLRRRPAGKADPKGMNPSHAASSAGR